MPQSAKAQTAKNPAAKPIPALPAMLARFALYFCALFMAFWLSWQLLAKVNFAYPLAYDWMHIEQHIQHYAPQNRYKRGFDHTTPDQHKQLFAGIVQAIQHNGVGLRTLNYTGRDGLRHTLLREPEAIHLQDVANLISLFNITGWGSLVMLIMLFTLLYWRSTPPPGAVQIGLGTLGCVASCGIVLMLFGPTQAFYWLHTHIFPADHEWFFYYQDSLMTTLMKAPDLFGFIGVLWALVALMLFAALHWCLQTSLGRFR